MSSFNPPLPPVELPPGYSPHLVVIVGPREDAGARAPRYRRNLVVAAERLPNGATLDSYARTQLALLGRSLPSFARVRSFELYILDSACTVHELMSATPEGARVTSLVAFVLAAPHVYTLTATHLTGTPFEAAREELIGMLQSFRPWDGQSAPRA